MTELAVVQSKAVVTAVAHEFTREELELIKTTICRGASDSELKLFVNTCKNLRLDPFARQIFAVKRWDSKERREVMSIQVSIDGFRLVAERTGQYGGQLGPFFSKGEVVKNERTGVHEIVWYDGWPFDEAPKLAKVGVLRKDFMEPLWAQAKLSSYAQTTKDGGLTVMWQKMPEIMLAKCAESLALRKAFPNELSGVYTTDEMGQANKDKQQRPVHVDQTDRIEKMLVAFQALYEKKTGQSGKTIRYVIEDICGGKKTEEFTELDLKHLQGIYADLNADKITFQAVMDELYPKVEEAPATSTEQIDAMFSSNDEKDLSQL